MENVENMINLDETVEAFLMFDAILLRYDNRRKHLKVIWLVHQFRKS